MKRKNPNQLYHKLFHRYTAIIVCIVFVLCVYFISATRMRTVETSLRYALMMEEKATNYIIQSADTVTNLLNSDLYQSSQTLADLIKYLTLDEESYIKYRLDTYSAGLSLEYEGFETFLERAMKSSPSILHIEIISYKTGRLTDCFPDGKRSILLSGEERLAEIESGALRQGEFFFQKEIRDPVSMQSIGSLIVSFDASEFEAIQKYYSKAEILISTEKEQIVFSSEGIANPNQLIQETNLEKLKGSLNAYINKERVKEYEVYSVLTKAEASSMSMKVYWAIIGLGLLVIIIGVFFIERHLSRLGNRLNYILNGMEKVRTGNLDTRLNFQTEGDELDLISQSFNEMCSQLERYIEKSFLAEIEQKNAEMEVLQSQINPHFLYNTLEAIRMKAIVNGDREVGKMLYSMAVIFRSQLKEADIITMIQEIHYCKKYLELFEFRYQGKFKFTVDCKEELMNYPIIKFILQPVLENYFIHGIRGEAEGNEVSITVEKIKEGVEIVPNQIANADMLLIHVADNGRGMEQEEIDRINKIFSENLTKDKKSIGLNNVNRRLKAIYGEHFGVLLCKNQGGGLHVIMKAGIGEYESNEKSNVD